MNTVWAFEEREPELNARLSQWASIKLFGHARGFGPCATMGVFEGSRLVSVVVYHDYAPERGVIEISGIAENKQWLTRPVLWEIGYYPFDQLGCQLVVMRVSERNRQANGRGLRRLLKAVGFSAVIVPRYYGRDEAGIIFSLTDEAWRAKFGRPPSNFRGRLMDTAAA